MEDTGWLEIIGTSLAINITKPSAGTSVKYRRKNGVVYISGTFGILNAPSTTNYPLFNIPEGFKPDIGGYYYCTNTASGSKMSRYNIDAAHVALEWVRDLGDGSMLTGNISWAGIDVSFPCK